jgi:DNA-binding protein Fis
MDSYNNYKEVFENSFCLIESLSYPTFIFDSEERIIKVNGALADLIKQSKLDIAKINARKMLKINGFKGKFKKERLNREIISVLRYKDQRVLHISLLTKGNIYVGGIVVMLNKKLQRTKTKVKTESLSKLELEDYLQISLIKMNNDGLKLKEFLNNLEKELIHKTIKKTNNKSEAIKLLGLSRRTFYYKLRKYKLL